ncbi:MAG: (2Fe-2S)-binding protein [Deltaproteobacteria bacterium]|nr:(2Fe-2S)-binding protein [Deltaproteobacteria bacterium]
MDNFGYDKKRVPVSQRHMSREATVHSDGTLVSVTVDGRNVDVEPGTTILEAATRLGIHIPTLCTHEDLCVVGNCRICVVEVSGIDTLQAACAWPITEPISVHTHSARIRRVRHHMIQLLLAHHPGECHACMRNGNCELSALAQAHGVTDVAFARQEETRLHDASSLLLIRDMKKCVLCRRCVRACIDMQEVGVMEAVGKGERIEIETFGNKPMRNVVCIGCGQCISHCPTAALVNPDETARVWQAIESPSKHVVIQLSPAVRVALTEALGMPPGTVECERLISMLRATGFDAVFDTQLAVSLVVEAQAKQIVQRLSNESTDGTAPRWPILSSNCSGWVKYMEYFAPHQLKFMSRLKSPQQLMGTLIRAHFAKFYGGDPSAVFSVSAVPCTAHKAEADSPLSVTAGDKNIDCAITTVELAKMLKASGARLSQAAKGQFDNLFLYNTPMTSTPFNSMLHLLCGAVYRRVTGRLLTRSVEVDYRAPFAISGAYIMEIPTGSIDASHDRPELAALKGQPLRFGKCEGTANAKKVLEDIRRGGPFSKCHFIEFLACPDGCFGGGGHPVPTGRQIRQARREAFPVNTNLPKEELDWITDLFNQCTDGRLEGTFSNDDFFTGYMPRGKFIK